MQTVFTDEVKAIHERIAEKIGACQYQVWFEGTTQLSLLNDGLQVTAANPFVSNWIEGHFHQALSESVMEVCGRKLPLHFQIDAGCVKPQAKPAAPTPSRIERIKTSHRRIPSTKGRDGRALPLKLTFETFVRSEERRVG